eukprot:1102927-Rhodomonas_salina.2
MSAQSDTPLRNPLRSCPPRTPRSLSLRTPPRTMALALSLLLEQRSMSWLGHRWWVRPLLMTTCSVEHSCSMTMEELPR